MATRSKTPFEQLLEDLTVERYGRRRPRPSSGYGPPMTSDELAELSADMDRWEKNNKRGGHLKAVGE